MNCEAFDRWLDDGGRLPGDAAQRAHHDSCPRCARALAAMNEIEALLALPAGPAPALFADRVMTRIADEQATRALVTRELRAISAGRALEPVAWWLRAAADPATALALVAAGAFLWKRGAVDAAARLMLSATTRALARLGSLDWGLPAALAGGTVQVGLMLALLPFALWLSWRLYHSAERAFAAGAGAIRPA